MKKLFLVIVLLFAFNMQAQERIKVLDFGTLTTYTAETKYLDLSGWSKIDSISILAVGTGEVDVDSIVVYGALQTTQGVWADVTVLGLGTVTLNLADGTEDVELIVTSTATILTGVALRGLNGLKVVVYPAAGCDATDPNKFMVAFQIWGTGS